jgi:hypothetical protein
MFSTTRWPALNVRFSRRSVGKAGERRLQHVLSRGRERGEDVAAILIGRDLARQPGRDILQRDRGAWQDGLLSIRDDALDVECRLLCSHRHGDGEDERGQDENTTSNGVRAFKSHCDLR